MDLRYAVLGPVRVWRDDVPLEIGSPQRQAVLAALLLRGGHPASAQELLNAVWGDDTPISAVGRLRTVVNALRRTLEPERPARTASRVLPSVNGGYALALGPEALDLTVMEAGVAEAEQASDPAQALDLLESALALWEGEPLSGVPGPYAATQRARLAERRLALLEMRIDLCLRLGRHADMVPELMTLTADHPLRERFRGQLMTALYRSGRQAEALEVYAATHELLKRDLGVEPSAELAAIHRTVLSQNPQGKAWPSQLPPDIPDFTGRTALVERLVGHLGAEEGMPIAFVHGMGGVGKTTLAVHVAHLIRDRFPDGHLYVDLNGAGPQETSPAEALTHFLRALGYPEGQVPLDEQERAALFRTAMAGRRMLVLLDNARDAAQVRPLLPGSTGSSVLLTSRYTLAGLPGALGLALEPLTMEEARRLFAQALAIAESPRLPEDDRVLAEPEATDAVLAACGRLPLAVRIVAARLAARPGWNVTAIAERLQDQRRRLTELKAGSLAVEATFRLGYGLLSSEQGRAFRLLATAEVPDLPVAAVAAVLDQPQEEAEEVCESLVDSGLLLCSAAPGRYRYHDLLRLFARGQEDEERSACLPRLLDFYLASAKNLLRLRAPGSLLPEHLRATTSAGAGFADTTAVQNWLDVERPNLLGLYRQAAHDSPIARRMAADLAWLTAESLDLTATTPEIASALRNLADASAAFPGPYERQTEARARTALGCLLGFSDQAEAIGQLRTSLELHRDLDDPRALAWTYYALGVCHHLSGDYGEAVRHYRPAVELTRQVGDPWAEGRILATFSFTHAWLGDHDSGLTTARRALTIGIALGNHAVQSHAHNSLGFIELLSGRSEGALEHFTESVRHAQAGHWRAQGGWAWGMRAVSLLSLGRTSDAAAAAEQAVQVLTEVGDAHHLPDALDLREVTRGLVSDPPVAPTGALADGLRQLGIL